jgi:hypothetical protein
VVPGDGRLEVLGTSRLEPRLTVMTQATVEAAKADTSVRDARWANAEKLKEVVEVPPEAG